MSNDICDSNNPDCKQTRFLLLLLSLLALMILEPFIYDYTRLKFLLDIFFTVIFFTCIYAVSEKKTGALIAVLLAVPKLATTWSFNFFRHPFLALLDPIFGIIFIGYIIVLVLRHIFRQKDVTLETIYGAIVAYILIGILWIYLYQLTEFIHPDSFSVSQALADDARKSLYHFSFVTLTTLGYGDITPVSGSARSLATLEAITGQMYIAVLIARLVGIHISQNLTKK